MDDIMKSKTLEVFKETLENDDPELIYEGDVETINHFNLLMKAGSLDVINKILGCNMCMMNYRYDNDPAILIIFSIPIVSKIGNKQMADRVMEIVENVEKCFITVDYTNSKEVKDDKFVYITIVKKIMHSQN